MNEFLSCPVPRLQSPPFVSLLNQQEGRKALPCLSTPERIKSYIHLCVVLLNCSRMQKRTASSTPVPYIWAVPDSQRCTFTTSSFPYITPRLGGIGLSSEKRQQKLCLHYMGVLYKNKHPFKYCRCGTNCCLNQSFPTSNEAVTASCN